MRLFTIEERRGFPALTRTRRQQRAALLDADDAVDQTSAGAVYAMRHAHI